MWNANPWTYFLLENKRFSESFHLDTVNLMAMEMLFKWMIKDCNLSLEIGFSPLNKFNSAASRRPADAQQLSQQSHTTLQGHSLAAGSSLVLWLLMSVAPENHTHLMGLSLCEEWDLRNSCHCDFWWDLGIWETCPAWAVGQGRAFNTDQAFQK